MYLEVSGVKKSYGEGGSYVQVLKGINTGVEKGQMKGNWFLQNVPECVKRGASLLLLISAMCRCLKV